MSSAHEPSVRGERIRAESGPHAKAPRLETVELQSPVFRPLDTDSQRSSCQLPASKLWKALCGKLTPSITAKLRADHGQAGHFRQAD